MLLDDPFGCFDTAVAEAAIGTAALTRYRKLLAARWREAKDAVLATRVEHAATAARVNDRSKHPFGFQRHTERDMRLWTLERLHLGQLEAERDIDGALAVMREDLTEVRHGAKCLQRGSARRLAGREFTQSRTSICGMNMR